MAVKMSLEKARAQEALEVKKDFTTELINFRKEYEGKELDVYEIYVFVSSSVATLKGIKRFKIDELDKATKHYMTKARGKAKRLFIGFGVEYTFRGERGRAEGAVDLIITGDEY